MGLAELRYLRKYKEITDLNRRISRLWYESGQGIEIVRNCFNV